jgi:uncharacterized protein (DUF433 family)/G:T/U-mismatch repair DNA glycosylase
MATLDWSQCPAVESVPGRVSGAWVFRDTRLPVATVIENLEDLSVEEVIEQFDVTREQIAAVLEFVAQSLRGAAPGQTSVPVEDAHSEKLRPYLRSQLDVLFVALNPPTESNHNGHWFSGSKARFFELLFQCGLITKNLDKLAADEVVFGLVSFNFKGCSYGVVDLVPEIVQSDSGQVQPSRQHVELLLTNIRRFRPRFVCVIHHKVRDAVNAHPDLTGRIEYGVCGPLLRDSDSTFVLNYFPNGNNIPDEKKLEIFRALKGQL